MIKYLFFNVEESNDENICKNGTQFNFYDEQFNLKQQFNIYYTINKVYFSKIENISNYVYLFSLTEDSYLDLQKVNGIVNLMFILDKKNWNDYKLKIDIIDEFILNVVIRTINTCLKNDFSAYIKQCVDFVSSKGGIK